jgi:hypothetical protein
MGEPGAREQIQRATEASTQAELNRRSMLRRTALDESVGPERAAELAPEPSPQVEISFGSTEWVSTELERRFDRVRATAGRAGHGPAFALEDRSSAKTLDEGCAGSSE